MSCKRLLNMFCSRPRGWVVKAKPTGQMVLGGYSYNFQHFQSFIIHSLHWVSVWFENQPGSILILDVKQKSTQFIWATPAPEHLSSYTVCGAHCILSHGPASPDIVINLCLLISIFWANLFLISISISVLLTSILWTNLVIFHLLKVFIVAVCVTWVLLFIEEINKTRL